MSTKSLNDILVECAQLRGCYPLMHRTLSEFSWFCNTCIFGWSQYDQCEMDEILKDWPDGWGLWSDARDEKEAIANRWHGAYDIGDNELLRFAEAFLEYCREEYNVDGDRL